MYDSLLEGGTGRLTRGLRERLQSMTMVAHLLGSAVAGNEKAEEYLAVLKRDICTQLWLVQQTELDHRLNGRGEIKLERTLVDLAALCRDVMEKVDALTRPLLDIRAEFISSLAALPTLADKGALENMLLGFVSNSVRAIGRSGSIRLKLERQKDQAVLTMTDTGGGLDAGALADLFGPREEPEIPARGLVLAQRIAKLHGGSLRAVNTGGEGVCLAAVIPIEEPPVGEMHRLIPVEEGGWDPALVALAEDLPIQAFLPDRGEP